MELWTFNTEHIQEGETNSRIDIRWSDRIVIIIVIIIIIIFIIIIINVNIIIIILIIREDEFSLCECVCLEKKIFKGLHQIFYVQSVFGYYKLWLHIPKDYLYVISKNFVEQFWRRRFLKVLQTGSKFLAFFNYQKFCQNACSCSFTITLTNYNGLGLGNLLA